MSVAESVVDRLDNHLHNEQIIFMGLYVRTIKHKDGTVKKLWYAQVSYPIGERYKNGKFKYKRITYSLEAEVAKMSKRRALLRFREIQQSIYDSLEIKKILNDESITESHGGNGGVFNFEVPKHPSIDWDVISSGEKYSYNGPGYVYILFEGTYTKIGISLNPLKRVRAIEKNIFNKVELVHVMFSENMERDEKNLHSTLAKYQYKGEWFNIGSELVKKMCEFKEADNLFEYLRALNFPMS